MELQLIETAPKNGSKILGFTKEFRLPIIMHYNGTNWVTIHEFGEFKYFPTHWMSLPEEPKNDLIKRIEEHSLNIKRYRDDEGNPTCAINFRTGDFCSFYRTQRMGTNETCVFADDEGKYSTIMRRRNKDEGSLIPLENCPVWNL